MKTTIEIADSLLEEARAYAGSRGLTLRQIMEEGLRAVIQAREMPGQFKLRDGSFGEPAARQANSWAATRETIYEGRGE